MARHDMFVELATDQVNQVQKLLDEGRYREVHDWLWPIFYKILKQELAELSDNNLKTYYANQMGVNIPSSPPLSSDDEETEEDLVEACFGKAPSEKASGSGSVPCTPPVEHGPLSDVRPLRYEEGVAQMAAALCGIGGSETPVSRRKRSSKV